MGMGTIAKGPRVTPLHFGGTSALELTIVYKVGLLGTQAHVTSRKVNGIPLPGLPLDGRLPRSRLEIFAGGAVVYRRAFATPGRVEVYGGIRSRWVNLPFGAEQVMVTLLPDLPGASRVVAIGPMGQWFHEQLL